VNRYIQSKKFYATLSGKLDQAEEKWHRSQPLEDNSWTQAETGTFGEDGWSISTSYKPLKTDD
jgi:hypothetical protein